MFFLEMKSLVPGSGVVMFFRRFPNSINGPLQVPIILAQASPLLGLLADPNLQYAAIDTMGS